MGDGTDLDFDIDIDIDDSHFTGGAPADAPVDPEQTLEGAGTDV